MIERKHFYLLASIVGLVVPYYFLGQFLLEYGLDVVGFVELLFANPVSAFFAVDVIVSAVVLIGFVYWEGKRLQMKRLWVYYLATLLVGVSFGLPLFCMGEKTT